MIIGTYSPPVQSQERPDVVLDCTDTIPAAGSVSSCTVTAKKYSDNTDLTATIIDGAATIASPIITQFIHNTTSGVDVLLTFHVTYSNGKILDEEIYIPCIDT
jgi:hypothetical protein